MMESMETARHSQSLARELQSLVENHLRQAPHLSLNGLSKRCGVTEPTLRRIAKGQLKSKPSASVLAKLLEYLTKSSDVAVWRERYPGPIADCINEILPASPHSTVDMQFSNQLNERLKHPTTFLIYSLAATANGLKPSTAAELFGDFGVKLAKELVDEGWLVIKDDRYFAKIENFTLGHDHFLTQFKALANFIKVNRIHDTQADLSPNHHMMTNGVSPDAYRKIRRIQKRAIKQMAELMFAPENQGPLPVFLLLALDTLSLQTAAEIGMRFEMK